MVKEVIQMTKEFMEQIRKISDEQYKELKLIWEDKTQGIKDS